MPQPNEGQSQPPAAESAAPPPPAPGAGPQPSLPCPVRRDWLCGLLLVLAVLFAYQPVWHAGFIWDDDTYIALNPTLHSWAGLWQIWFTPGATVQYYPLTFTTFWIEYHLWGLHAPGYHVINILLHAANAILVWLILRRLAVPGAWLAAALFALHPVNVESVAWITEHKNTLSGLCYLGSLWFALKFWRLPETAPGAGRGSWRFYWLAFVLYVFALWSKTTTLPLPAVILLLVWWQRGRLAWREVWPLGLFLAAGVAMGLMTLHTEHHLGAAGPGWALSWLQRCLLAGYDVWFYLGKLLWPHPLIFVYPRWTIQTSAWEAYVPVLALGAGLAITWWRRKAWGRAPLAALLYFIALLFLALGFFNVYYFRYSYVADHFQYLAGIGPLALAAAGITLAFRMLSPNHSPIEPPDLGRDALRRVQADQQVGPTGGARCGASEADRQVGPTEVARWLQPAFCAALLLTLGVLTWRQARTYADLDTLWRTTLERNPATWLAENNLGDLLLHQGQLDKAMVHFQRAIDIKPDNPESYDNLGNALLQEGRMEEGIAQLQKALAIQPDFVGAHVNWGSALLRQGKVDEAIRQFQTALTLRPESAIIHYDLGNALLRKGKLDEALQQLEQALSIEPGSPDAHNAFGKALAQKGLLNEAIPHFQRAVDLDPALVDAQFNLGNGLAQAGQLDAAIVHFQAAVSLRPDYAEARNNLGNALFQRGRLLEAIAQYQQVLALQPDNVQALNNLGSAYVKQGRVDEAVIKFQQALALQPGLTDARISLGDIFLQKGDAADALTNYQAALQTKPDSAITLNNLAWILATSPDAALRNGAQAVQYASRACELTRNAVPSFLGTLAAAYAEAGRFPDAVATAQKARDAAQAAGQKDLAASDEKMMELYQAGRPYRAGAK